MCKKVLLDINYKDTFSGILVPFMAGEMVQSMGFPTIMRLLGVCNFIYGPFLLIVTIRHNLNVSMKTATYVSIIFNDDLFDRM